MKIESLTAVSELNKSKNDGDRKLKEACQDFEAIFLSFLMKSMRKTVTESDLFGSRKEENTFRDMLDIEICSKASKSNTAGIADMLYKQLASTQESINETKTQRGDGK